MRPVLLSIKIVFFSSWPTFSLDISKLFSRYLSLCLSMVYPNSHPPSSTSLLALTFSTWWTGLEKMSINQCPPLFTSLAQPVLSLSINYSSTSFSLSPSLIHSLSLSLSLSFSLSLSHSLSLSLSLSLPHRLFLPVSPALSHFSPYLPLSPPPSPSHEHLLSRSISQPLPLRTPTPCRSTSAVP